MEIKDKTIALLIDSDNISREYYSVLLEELSKYGRVTYRRLYGDFSKPKQNGWQSVLLEHSIEQRQQSNYTKGKNSTDSSMIIDAIDILYTGKVDCFCLATSDSDFTGLAVRFRNDNLIVIGAGEKKTPQSFRHACDRFIAIDDLLQVHRLSRTKDIAQQTKSESKTEPKAKAKRTKKQNNKSTQTSGAKINDDIGERSLSNLIEDAVATSACTTQHNSDCIEHIVDIVDDIEPSVASKQDILDYAMYILSERADENGWMFFSAFVDGIYRKYNDFNPKLYGQSNSQVGVFFKSQQQDGKPIFKFDNIGNILKIARND
ncbi:MAG: NYN domain-containing protein [Clostridiales bacterium]|jgi:uncharacterized LabA/DUF88 family protein|nr:NYN domain-containing protein [Clostridiales bacterium]